MIQVLIIFELCVVINIINREKNIKVEQLVYEIENNGTIAKGFIKRERVAKWVFIIILTFSVVIINIFKLLIQLNNEMKRCNPPGSIYANNFESFVQFTDIIASNALLKNLFIIRRSFYTIVLLLVFPTFFILIRKNHYFEYKKQK